MVDKVLLITMQPISVLTYTGINNQLVPLEAEVWHGEENNNINCTTSQHNALIDWQNVLVTMLPPSSDHVVVTLYKLLVYI